MGRLKWECGNVEGVRGRERIEGWMNGVCEKGFAWELKSGTEGMRGRDWRYYVTVYHSGASLLSLVKNKSIKSKAVKSFLL